MGPICKRHNTHTYIGNTRQPEPQLKICHFEPQFQEYHVLNPYPEPQLKGYVLSHNSRNYNKSTFEKSSKLCRPSSSKTSKNTIRLLRHCLVLLLSHQAKFDSKPPGKGHIPPGARCPKPTNVAALAWRDLPHRKAPLASKPIVCSYHLTDQTSPPRTTPVIAQYWFLFWSKHSDSHRTNISTLPEYHKLSNSMPKAILVRMNPFLYLHSLNIVT